jgi:lysophospholipase L1-like esterase
LDKDEPNRAGWTLLQFVDAIKEIANQHKQCFLIDLFAMPYDVTCTQDGLHPNKKGMRLIANYVAEQYKQITKLDP